MAAGVSSGSVVPANARNFGKYQLVLRLATGGMAEIFLARLKAVAGFERFVVIKRILPHLDEDEQFVAMFLDEARIAARITHANVCQVYELGEVDGQYFLAMEYLEGITLNSAMRKLARERQPADARLVAGVMQQACEGLHYAHELRDLNGPLGIVHRDVSPQNLFVTVEGLAKVLDFGIAKAQGASSRTRTGTVKGKYAYMPPEQLRGDPLDRRVDVWALGVVLFEALTGKRLFWRDTDFLIFRAITDEPIPHVRDYRPDVPAALDAAVARALSRNRDDRFANARVFGEAMASALASVGGPLSTAAVSVEVQRLFREEIEAHRALVAEATRMPVEEEQTSKVSVRPPTSPLTGPGTAPLPAALTELPTQTLATTELSARIRGKVGNTTDRVDTRKDGLGEQDTVDDSRHASMISGTGARAPTTAERPPRGMLPLPAPDDREPSRLAPSMDDAVPVASSVPSMGTASNQPSLVSGTALVGARSGSGSYQTFDAPDLRPRRSHAALWIGLVVVVAAIVGVVAFGGGEPGAAPKSTAVSNPSGAGSSGDLDAARAAAGADAAGRNTEPLPGPKPLPVVTPPDAGAGGGGAEVGPGGAATPDGAGVDDPNGKEPVADPVKPPVDAPPRDKPRDRVRPKDPPREKPPRERPPRDPEPREPKEPIKDPTPAGPPGFVSIDSDPYATIYIDGKKIGVTPLARIPLAPGAHRVRAVSSRGGEQLFNVTIDSGKDARGKKLTW